HGAERFLGTRFPGKGSPAWLGCGAEQVDVGKSDRTSLRTCKQAGFVCSEAKTSRQWRASHRHFVLHVYLDIREDHPTPLKPKHSARSRNINRLGNGRRRLNC